MHFMKITVAPSAGFCFGVRRAIRTALDTARQGVRVEMLGDIVHNEDVVSQVEAAGVRKVDELGDGRGKTLLIRAHGAAKQIVEDAQQRGYSIVDATCPMVKEIHTIVEDFHKRGLRVIIIGDADHEEVQGIRGQIDAPVIIIDSAEHIPREDLKNVERAGVVVQSTQKAENVRAIVDELQPHFKELEVCNTICKATTTRQQEIKTLPKGCDVVLVIGSRSSANTRRLYEIARELNSRSYWIQSRDDIDLAWFAGAATVCITAGASTPQETIDDVVGFLEKCDRV
jgi:4-hydroxy-3-methylbut-2-en-1-yl diphosphate reductase